MTLYQHESYDLYRAIIKHVLMPLAILGGGRPSIAPAALSPNRKVLRTPRKSNFAAVYAYSFTFCQPKSSRNEIICVMSVCFVSDIFNFNLQRRSSIFVIRIFCFSFVNIPAQPS